MKEIEDVTTAKTYALMKAKDVKNENQMKSGFFRGGLTAAQGKAKYHIGYRSMINATIKYLYVA